MIPRTLSFLVHGEKLLLLRGSAHKRLWAGKLNGLGGHVEAGEDLLTSARREIVEETGLETRELELCGIVHISGKDSNTGVILFVFVGKVDSIEFHASPEGQLGWYPLEELPWSEMVSDLPMLLPRILSPQRKGQLTYGRYVASASGEMTFHFQERGAKGRAPCV